jgi:hypothetical protein
VNRIVIFSSTSSRSSRRSRGIGPRR